jgi:hypothetical protein
MADKNGVVIDLSALTLPTERKPTNPFGTEAKGKEEKESTKIWLNVGVRVADPENEGQFIQLNLSLGIPCDKMKPLAIPKDKDGRNPMFKAQRQAQAKLLEQFQTGVMAKLKPGQRLHLPQFSVEAYHVEPGETLETADLSENPFLASLQAQMAPKTEVKAAGAVTEAKVEAAATA